MLSLGKVSSEPRPGCSAQGGPAPFFYLLWVIYFNWPLQRKHNLTLTFSSLVTNRSNGCVWYKHCIFSASLRILIFLFSPQLYLYSLNIFKYFHITKKSVFLYLCWNLWPLAGVYWMFGLVNFIFLTSVFCKGLYYHAAGSRYDVIATMSCLTHPNLECGQGQLGG